MAYGANISQGKQHVSRNFILGKERCARHTVCAFNRVPEQGRFTA